MRNVVVTGGTKGLGLAIARRLAEAGWRVIAVARGESEAFAAAAAHDGGAGRLQFRPCDLLDLDAIPRFVAGLAEEFRPLYGLVNGAGIGTTGTLAMLRDSDIDRLLRLNVAAPILFTKYAVRAMMVGRGGRIVNISSVVAATGYSGLSVYAATKASLVGFTRSLARELGPLDITVNCVAPGFIDTDMTSGISAAFHDRIMRRSALGRLPDPGDVADAVEYLMSDRARNVTGTTLTVDAGNTA